MTCVQCRRLEEENQRLRRLVNELWADFVERHKQHHGYHSEPVPPALLTSLRMWTGETLEPAEEAA